MSTEHSKLAAVLFADMVGYSLRGQGLALDLRREMMALADECLSACQGRLIKTAGDEVFAEFPSGSAAITCATRLQEAVARRNAGQPRSGRFLLRIGINAGEVALEGEDLIGGTVNVAKRAEQLAAPGGICVTETVWRQAETGLQTGFTRLGMISVKADVHKQVFFHHYADGTSALARRAHQFRMHYARLGRLAFAVAILFLVAIGLRLAWPVEDPDKLVDSGMKLLERYDLPHHIEDAIAFFKRAQQQDASSPKAISGHAWAYWLEYQEHGDPFFRSEAARLATNALNINPDTIYAHVACGLVAETRGDFHDATNHLIKANDLSLWQNGCLIVRLAEATRLAGNRGAALGFAQHAETAAGQSWEAWHRLGVFWYGENDFTNSLRAFRHAMGFRPTSSKSTEQANGVLIGSGRKLEALEQASQFKKHNDSPEAFSVYGSACLLADEDMKAYDAFKHAADLCPTNYLYCGNAGLALFMTGTNALTWTKILANDAIVLARAILNGAPGNAQVRACLATYEAAVGEKSSGLSEAERDTWNQAALADADRAFNESPFLPDIITNLKLPYIILERSDRVAQCDARLRALNAKP